MSSVKKIIHKHSSVVDKLPRTDELDYGEIAINYASGKEFISLKNADNQIIKIAPNIFERKNKNSGITLIGDENSIAKNKFSFTIGRNSVNYGDSSFLFNLNVFSKFLIEKIEDNKITTTLTEKFYVDYQEFLQDCFLKVVGENIIKTIKKVSINSENKIVLEVDDTNNLDISKKVFIYLKGVGENSRYVFNIGGNVVDDVYNFTYGLFNIVKVKKNNTSYGFNAIYGETNYLKGTDNCHNFLFGYKNKINGNLNNYNLLYGFNNEINNSNQNVSFIFGANNKVLKNNNTEVNSMKMIAGKNDEAKSNCNEFIFGDFNSSNEDTLFAISNGDSESNRHNAFEVKKSGEIFIQKDKVNTSEMISLQDKLSEISEKQKTIETDLSGINELLNKIIGES